MPESDNYKAENDVLIRQKDELRASSIERMFDGVSRDCSLTGDPHCLRMEARRIHIKLLENAPLDAEDRWWLTHLLGRVQKKKLVAVALCTMEKRKGAPKNSWNSWRLASDVVYAINERGATSIEDAWAIVAELNNLSANAVQKHWTKNKKAVLSQVGKVLQGYPEIPESASDWLKDLMASNKSMKESAHSRTGKKASNSVA